MPRPIAVVISGKNKLSATLGKVGTELNKFGKKAKSVGKSLTLGLTLPILAAGAASVKSSNDFHESMAAVSTLIPENVQRINELGKSVKDLSIITGKTTDDISAGLYQTISAFGDSESTVNRLTIALKASTAGMADTQSTLAMLSGVTKAYGDTSEAALQKVSDLAFKTVELGETTFPELASEMGKVNSIASTLGVTQEEMFASFAAGTGPLGNTASVATKLSGAMVALLKPSGDMEIAFKKLGVASGKELIKTKGLRGALQAVSDVANKYGGNLAKIYGRKEALQFALSMTGAQAEAFEEKLIKLNGSAGATETAFEKMTAKNPGFALRQFTRRVQVLAIELGDMLVPVLNKVIDRVTPIIQKFGALDTKTKGWILASLGIVAAIGPVIFTIGALAQGISGLIFVVKGLGAALIFLATNPVGMVITAVGLLAFGIYQLVKNWDTVKKFFIETWARISSIFQTKVGIMIATIMPFIGIPLLIAANWEKVVKVFDKVVSVGSKIGKGIKGFFGGEIPDDLGNKAGLITDQKQFTDTFAGARRAAEVIRGTTEQKSTTNIRIENKADAKIRADVEEGTINLETQTGEIIPAVG